MTSNDEYRERNLLFEEYRENLKAENETASNQFEEFVYQIMHGKLHLPERQAVELAVVLKCLINTTHLTPDPSPRGEGSIAEDAEEFRAKVVDPYLAELDASWPEEERLRWMGVDANPPNPQPLPKWEGERWRYGREEEVDDDE
jgi:hypothetical protein